MKCYRYEGDRLVACEDYGPMTREPAPRSREEIEMPVVYRSRQERRRIARSTSGPGRRDARRVRAWHVPLRRTVDLPASVALRGHLLRGCTTVRLYLPEGVPLTAAHLTDVDRAHAESRGPARGGDLTQALDAIWGPT